MLASRKKHFCNKEATNFQHLSQTKREEDSSVSLEQTKSQPREFWKAEEGARDMTRVEKQLLREPL